MSRGRGRRALIALALALGFVAAGGGAAAGATSPVTCDQMVGPELLAQLAAEGLVARPESKTPLFPADAALQCWWYHPDSPRIVYFGAGYMPAGPELVAAETARLLAIPSFFQDGADMADGARLRSDGRLTDTMADFVDGSWQFQARDGHWFFVVSPTDLATSGAAETRPELDARVDAAMAGIQQNVLDALAPDVVASPVDASDTGGEGEAAPGGFTAGTPSTLSGLQTVGDASVTALSLGGCLAVAVVLVALVGLPGRLVEGALTARYEEWARFAAPFGRGADRLRAGLDALPRAVVLGGGLVVASLLAALIEPELGFNGGSARLVLSLLIGFTLESMLGLALIAMWLARRGMASRLALRPGSLAIVLATALLSRASGFEPGFVFGLVLTLALLGDRTERAESRASILEGAWLLVLGAAGWAAYSGATAAGWAQTGVLGLFAVETLAAVTVGCLSALPLAMLPLPGLPGRALWRRGRLRWAVAEGVGVAVFVFVVLPFPQSWDAVQTPFATWVIAFAVYAVLAVAVWAVITFVPSRWLTTGTEQAAPPDRKVDTAV